MTNSKPCINVASSIQEKSQLLSSPSSQGISPFPRFSSRMSEPWHMVGTWDAWKHLWLTSCVLQCSFHVFLSVSICFLQAGVAGVSWRFRERRVSRRRAFCSSTVSNTYLMPKVQCLHPKYHCMEAIEFSGTFSKRTDFCDRVPHFNKGIGINTMSQNILYIQQLRLRHVASLNLEECLTLAFFMHKKNTADLNWGNLNLRIIRENFIFSTYKKYISIPNL